MTHVKLKCGVTLNVGHLLAGGDNRELSFAEARALEQRFGIDLRTNDDDTNIWNAFLQTDPDEPNSFWFTVFDDVNMYEYDVERDPHPLMFRYEVVKRITPLYIKFDDYREFLERLPRPGHSATPPDGILPNATLLLIGIDSGITSWNNHDDNTAPIWYDVELPRRDTQFDRDPDYVGQLEVYIVPSNEEE